MAREDNQLQTESSAPSDVVETLNVEKIDEEVVVANERDLKSWRGWFIFAACVGYAAFHLITLNMFPMETWSFRITHIAGALVIGFILMAARKFQDTETGGNIGWSPSRIEILPGAIAALLTLMAVVLSAYAAHIVLVQGQMAPPPWVWEYASIGTFAAAIIAIISSWLFKPQAQYFGWYDVILATCSVLVCVYLLINLAALQSRAGVMPTPPDFWMSLTGIILIMELTRRVAGLPLIIIALVFISYSFLGPYLPGILEHSGYRASRFFTYIYTDNGILGPTVAVSSTYIILFIIFAAFLQESRVGEYFVNFAFAIAGRTRGGPAKVAVFSSGLMGMINGTSAGNVVATGSLTIPLMKKVGYRSQSAASIEAASSTGGQIMPPIMGAGAFIMAEITGIKYTELMMSAIIPAILYFAAVFLMVDFEAQKLGMKGLPSSALPRLNEILKKIFLFIPIIILIYTLLSGYSVIRAGTMSLIAAVVVSWLTTHRMGPIRTINALNRASRMAIQLIAVCACAGIIVGVIGLTGVGLRFSSMLLQLADTSQLLALGFAMVISIILGMGMPTTAAYAVAASVIAPGLIRLGIDPLTAHFFVFYYAVISAITPPVALAAYAGAAIAGSDPMRTSVTAFKFGLAAFIVPYMFFYAPGLLLQADAQTIAQNMVTALIGIFLLASAVQAWYFGHAKTYVRVPLLIGAISMISGGTVTDILGISIGLILFFWQKRFASTAPLETPREPASPTGQQQA
ncbi:TRAP transporter permease [Fodinicurvata sediminis]|uniref:TRAP transporter permease n=1 Tax=Fodinicurvata sediminis TaxID=1121832 RepID=UPI0003B6200A|nr:TRAP transporter permease [Fodinicurvata sediminis]